MSGFSVDWLALREPVDAAARCARLGRVVVDSLEHTRLPAACIEVIDLGAGTGANLRYAAPLIGVPQRWLLVDNDAALLQAAGQAAQRWQPGFACEVHTLAVDLATQLARLPLRAGGLLTASALLDLVSENWLQELIERGTGVGAVLWFALTYDGRVQWRPREPEDEEVRELVNRHQLTDKGFGAALGPAAAPVTQRLLAARGYQVHCAASDWLVPPERSALQLALAEGWCRAATEIAPQCAPMLQAWLARRRMHIAAARSELRVGHQDIVGHP